jgi:DUF4097 and DUF4098 domain-containing protein YvlB
MPTTHHSFATPEPITLRLTSNRGTVEIVAADTSETTVDITGPHEDPPVVVEISRDGRTVTVEPRRRLGLHDRLAMTVRLPAGSKLNIHTASADVEVQGSVAEARIQTASGTIRVDQVQGASELHTASGSVRIGSAGGAVGFQSASGSLHVDRAGAGCSARTASGSVAVDVTDGDVSATTVSGRIEVGEAHRGALDLRATSGSVGVGVRQGTLVQYEVSSVSGRVQSTLHSEDPPTRKDAASLSVRARTVSGSISFSSVSSGAIAL